MLLGPGLGLGHGREVAKPHAEAGPMRTEVKAVIDNNFRVPASEVAAGADDVVAAIRPVRHEFASLAIPAERGMLRTHE
jgi:hypothetical protein